MNSDARLHRPELPKGKSPEYYVSRFLSKFGAAIGRGVLYRDQAGQAVLVSDALFRNMDGSWKAMKRRPGRADGAPGRGNLRSGRDLGRLA